LWKEWLSTMPLLNNKSTSEVFLAPFLYVNVESEIGEPTSLAMLDVATLTLGSRPRQGVRRWQAKKKTRESFQMLLGVQRV
jgi:hypothetical protein